MSGAVSANNLFFEKKRVDQEYSSFKNLTQDEIKKLRRIKAQLTKEIEDTRSEITVSERP